ncbi:MAG: acyl carrier protein [Alphaproteobacteria bacterium]
MSSVIPADALGAPGGSVQPDPQAAVRRRIRAYISENLLLDTGNELEDDTSLVESGILDSTGAMELVAFLEEAFGVTVADEDLVPANLDSVNAICAFVGAKLACAIRR